MNKKLSPHTFALTGAIWSAIGMLLLGIAGNLGIYTNAVKAMQNWHIFFSLNIIGIITGMAEAAIVSYIGIYLFIWIYNQLIK